MTRLPARVCQYLLIISLVLFCFGIATESAWAQTRFQIGDKVEIDFGGKKQGTIVEILQNGWIRIEVASAGGATMNPALPPDRVTLVETANNTPNVPLEIREWQDSAGKFKVRASLLEQTGSEVKLKKDDGRVVQVAIDRLCEADQNYLVELAEAESEDNPFAGGVMVDAQPNSQPPASASTIGGLPMAPARPINLSPSRRIVLADAPWNVKPDRELDEQPVHNTRSVGLPDTGFKHPVHNRLSPPSLSADESVAAYVATNPFNRGQSQIHVADLVNGEAKSTTVGLADLKSVAVSPSGRTLAVTRERRANKGRIDFFANESGTLSHIKGLDIPTGTDAEFLSDDLILIQVKDGSLYVVDWNAETTRTGIRTGHGSAFALSSNRRLLAVHQDNAVFVVDLEDEKVVGSQPLTANRAWLSFSSDGGRLAAQAGHGEVCVWNVADGQELSRFWLPSPGARGDMAWAGDRFLLVGGKDLIDTRLRTVVWSYTGATPVAGRDGKFWFIPAGLGKPATGLFAAELPEPGLVEAVENYSAEDLVVLKPGTAISIKMDLPFSSAVRQRISERLEQNLETAGYVVDQAADLELRAGVVRGKRDTIEYGDMLTGPFLRRGNETKVTFSPNICTLSLHDGQQSLWATAQTYTAPHIVSQSDSKSIQQIVSEACQPQPAFFEQAQLPEWLSRLPGKKRVLGTSEFTSSGLR